MLPRRLAISLAALSACAALGCDGLAPAAAASTAASPSASAPKAARNKAKRARTAASGVPAASGAVPAVSNGASASTSAPAGSGTAPATSAPAGSVAAATQGAPASFSCPAGMQHVTGGYCRNVEQRCLEYIKGKDDVEDESRCLRFEQPSVCLDTRPRVAMDYCIDTFEFPNREGELPRTLTDWTTAAELCEDAGKRLCSESEWNFACEGEEMRPYATGFARAPELCHYDLPFHRKRVTMQSEPLCMANPACKAEFERLDQRSRSGEHPGCVSPFGVRDMNGNVNEWTSRMWMPAPKRSALKGGWWGPVRNRCRAIALSHHEDYVGYEVGFRCCSDGAKPQKKPKPTP